MIGCLRRVIGLLLLVIILLAAWLFRDRIRDKWREVRGLREDALVPSEQLADMSRARLDSLQAGQLERAAFSQVELQSLLQYGFVGLVPGFVDSARVELDRDQIRLRARVPLDKLPRVDELGEAASFLPDTSELTLAGTLLPLDSGRVAFAVDAVTAARIPLPQRFVPGALRRLGRTDEPGLPADAIALRLPPGASSAYVRNDSLVLLKRAR